MLYNEEIKDLFKVGEEYYIAHCISSDAKMGAGIAVPIRKKYKLNKLQRRVSNDGNLKVGSCVLVGKVFNLVTKKNYWNKPTYDSFKSSLLDMKYLVVKYNLKKIAMPQIGAGLDKLSWNKNREIIKEVFSDLDVEILVCKLKN